MNFLRINKNVFVILGIDFILLLFSLYTSHLIRFDFRIPDSTISWIINIIPVILFIKIVCFLYFDLYRGMWRYTGIADLVNILKGATLSTLLIICYIFFIHRFEGFSRSVFAIDWCFTIFLISAFRLCIRFYFERIEDDKLWNIISMLFIGFFIHKKDDKKRLLIIGAGDCGEKIFRDIHHNSLSKYKVVGFLDDNPVKVGKKIHGIPVLNYIRYIKNAAHKVDADEALIAIPSASEVQVRKIVDYCKDSEMKFMTVPSMNELINGHVSVNVIRKIAYRDLLGREINKLDMNSIGAYIKNNVILVTGAGGSIGSELCRQICRFKPEKIILYEVAETPLYEIELELKSNFNDIEIVPILSDIQNIIQLEKNFEKYKPHVVFHAAAYKHVPMLEIQPWKAIENNIIGTLRVLECSKKVNVESFVFVSTDKAVRPANIMGVSKRIAEILIQNQNLEKKSNTRFMIVRFGNVVGSAGSVVPLFQKQIEKGGPVTVTHPEVTRYFMTIPEASQLILQAGAMGSGGEIFVLDMGTPVKIVNMARDLIRLSGYEPDIDIKIEYIGLRKGEKLYEELITVDEGIVPTPHKKIMTLKGPERCLKKLNGSIDKLSKIAVTQDTDQIKAMLKEIIPEYSPM